MRRLAIILAFVLMFSGFGLSGGSAQVDTQFKPGEILVNSGDGPILGWKIQQVELGQELAEVAKAKAQGKKAEVNGLWEVVETIPNDPRYPEQYGPARIRAPEAWDLATGADVLISIIDTGVFCGHEDLIGKCVAGYDFVNKDTDPADDHGHGTHVSGIAAAVTDNGVGISGMCWGCAIQPVKVLNSGGSGSWEQVASGIVWATDNGSDVISMSLGGSGYSQLVEDAVNYAWVNGVLIFAAAGNTGGTPILYPAAYEAVIAVAATDASDNRASFSSYGAKVELSAPGVSNLSTVPPYTCALCDPTGYHSYSGTSMATPHAAGAGAVLLSYSGMTNTSARAVLDATAKDLGSTGRDVYYGFGLVDLYAVLMGEIPPTPVPTEPPPPTSPPLPTPIPTPEPTPEPGTAICGKYTGGSVWTQIGSPYHLTCDADMKGGLSILNASVELRGHALNVSGSFMIVNSRIIP